MAGAKGRTRARSDRVSPKLQSQELHASSACILARAAERATRRSFRSRVHRENEGAMRTGVIRAVLVLLISACVLLLLLEFPTVGIGVAIILILAMGLSYSIRTRSRSRH
jgi:Flp pilus assembly protein TadB